MDPFSAVFAVAVTVLAVALVVLFARCVGQLGRPVVTLPVKTEEEMEQQDPWRSNRMSDEFRRLVESVYDQYRQVGVNGSAGTCTGFARPRWVQRSVKLGRPAECAAATGTTDLRGTVSCHTVIVSKTAAAAVRTGNFTERTPGGRATPARVPLY